MELKSTGAALAFLIFAFSFQGGVQALVGDPCNLAQLIDEPFRSTGYTVNDQASLICDRLLPVGWYKFPTGIQMPTTCPPQKTCGTHVPIWLNGQHPTVADGIATIETCGHTSRGCCIAKNHIRVKNCQTFYAYELVPPPGCSSAYCAGNGVPCPPDQYSPTGFSPGCKPAYPKVTQNPHLSPPLIKGDTFVFPCHIQYAPTQTDVGFEVTWLFDGKSDPSIPKTQVTGSSRDTELDQKYLKGHLGTDVTCAVRSYFLTSPARKGPKVGSNPYWAGIKISTPRLTIGENDKPRPVQLISTIPIVCNRADQVTCKLPVYLSSNSSNIRQTENCTQYLRPTDWNPATHQAVTTFQVLAARDYKKNGDQNHVLHFNTLYSYDGPPVFNKYQIQPLQILTKDKSSGLCQCISDPNCITMDMHHLFRNNHYSYYNVGEFTMYKSTSRPFEVQVRTRYCEIPSCICAVAVREGNDVIIVDICHDAYGHTFPKVIVQHNGQLSPGTVVHRDQPGRRYLIDLPSGAWVKATVNQYGFMNVDVHAPEDDFAATQGLCGTFNGNSKDDLTGKDGQVHPFSLHPTRFVESWRVRMGESFFDKEVPLEAKYNHKVTYCKCNQQNITDCRPDYIANRQPVHTRCAGCNQIAVGNTGTTLHGRGKRSTAAVHTDGPLKYNFDYGLFDFPMVGSFPTKSGITQTMAEKTCRDAHHENPTIQQCVTQIGLDTSAGIGICVDDIKQADNYHFVSAAVESSIMACVEKAITYPQYFDNSTGLPPAFITTDRCALQCTKHGACVRGTCRCHPGYTGDSCEVRQFLPPNLFGIDTTDTYVRTSQICDVTINPCTSITVIGNNIMSSSNLHCSLAEMKFDGQRFVPTQKTRSVGAEYLSINSVACRMPIQPPSNGHVAIGYNISVSNNGHQFSNAVPALIVNSTCLNCPPSGSECSIKANTCLIDGICRSNGEVRRESRDSVCDPVKNNKAWTDLHVHPTATNLPDSYSVAPLGGTPLARYDIWTTKRSGCQCAHDPKSNNCACCDDGGCQCTGSNAHQCVQCGHSTSCGTPVPAPDFGVDGYTLALTDCKCNFDITKNNCACCQDNVNACQCGIEHRNQCVDCKHMDRCGSKPWIFGPPMH